MPRPATLLRAMVCLLCGPARCASLRLLGQLRGDGQVAPPLPVVLGVQPEESLIPGGDREVHPGIYYDLPLGRGTARKATTGGC